MASQEVGGDDRSFCVLYESLLWCLFCAGVGSHGCGYGCHAPAMGFSSGIRLSFVPYNSLGSGKAEVVARHGSHSWPQRLWFPDRLDLLLEPPLPLPDRWDLRKFYQNLTVLQLHAWRLAYRVLRQSLWFLCEGGWKAWLLPTSFFSSQLSVEVGFVCISPLVYGHRPFGFQPDCFEGG